jgi:hypothetical protein
MKQVVYRPDGRAQLLRVRLAPSASRSPVGGSRPGIPNPIRCTIDERSKAIDKPNLSYRKTYHVSSLGSDYPARQVGRNQGRRVKTPRFSSALKEPSNMLSPTGFEPVLAPYRNTMPL